MNLDNSLAFNQSFYVKKNQKQYHSQVRPLTGDNTNGNKNSVKKFEKLQNNIQQQPEITKEILKAPQAVIPSVIKNKDFSAKHMEQWINDTLLEC